MKISTSEPKQNLTPLSTIEIKQYVDPRKNFEVHAYLIQIMILPFFCYNSLANCFIFICIVWDLCFMRWLKMNFDLIEHKKFLQFFWNAGNHAEEEGVYNSHCSRITRYASFISLDFFHFSTFTHNGDNLNL